MHLNSCGIFYLLGPLCNIPVAVRPGQDPNVRMDIHLEKECSVVTGKVKSKSTPTCSRGNCKKVLFSPIRCDVRSLSLMISSAFNLIYVKKVCKDQFCAAHRFPQDHNCSTTAQSKSTGQHGPNTYFSGVKITSAVGAAAVRGVKKASTVASTSRTDQPSTSSSSKVSLPFNKTDR
jgi:hypothetical protein